MQKLPSNKNTYIQVINSFKMNELDKLYSPSFWSNRLPPNEILQFHLDFINTESQIARLKVPCQLDISYESTDRTKLNYFGIDLQDEAPIFVFIHGGYWNIKEIGRESYEFIAVNLYENNIKSIFIGYDLCPDLKVPEIFEQIKKAIKKCIKYAKEKKSSGLYLCGHSAGGHLVASLFTNFITTLTKDDQFLIKAAILVSGIFDLRPIQKSCINKPLNLDEEMAMKISPLKQFISNGVGTIFYLFVGESESPELVRQSREFYEKITELNYCCDFNIIEEVDHFDIIESLSNKHFQLTKRIIEICKQ